MKFFKKTEISTIMTILIALSVVVFFNLQISYRRGRDATRKDDISDIQKRVESYYAKYGIYPLSTTDGKIIGCFEKGEILDLVTGYPTNAIPCEWGKSKTQEGNLMPRDPSAKDGGSYVYISNGNGYKVYISLEGKDEAEYQIETEKENIYCGTKVCNYKRVVN